MYAITAIGPESWPLNAAKGNQTFLNWYAAARGAGPSWVWVDVCVCARARWGVMHQYRILLTLMGGAKVIVAKCYYWVFAASSSPPPPTKRLMG